MKMPVLGGHNYGRDRQPRLVQVRQAESASSLSQISQVHPRLSRSVVLNAVPCWLESFWPLGRLAPWRPFFLPSPVASLQVFPCLSAPQDLCQAGILTALEVSGLGTKEHRRAKVGLSCAYSGWDAIARS